MLEQKMIGELLANYCSKNKYADEEFIRNVSAIISESRKCDNYVKDVKISNQIKNGTCAYYDYYKQRMMISLPNVNKNVIEYNFKILHFILHEFEHVNQYMVCDMNDKSLKVKLLRENFADNYFCKEIEKIDFNNISPAEINRVKAQMKYFMERKKMYSEIYFCLVSERMAEIDSFKYIVDLFKQDQLEDFKEEKEKYNKGLNIRKILGYEFDGKYVQCPTFKYFDMLNLIAPNPADINKKLLPFSKQMNLENRLYHGLPISSKEYIKVLSKTI